MIPKKLKEHKPARLQYKKNDNRGSSTARGYGSDWQRLRLWFLCRNPLCKHCGKPAEDIDHIRPLRAGGARLDQANLQSLCRACHTKKTAEDKYKWPQ
jgi:5-methylcytosine-specific restriction protein A